MKMKLEKKTNLKANVEGFKHIHLSEQGEVINIYTGKVYKTKLRGKVVVVTIPPFTKLKGYTKESSNLNITKIFAKLYLPQIPENYTIGYKDGNMENLTIDNLEIIPNPSKLKLIEKERIKALPVNYKPHYHVTYEGEIFNTKTGKKLTRNSKSHTGYVNTNLTYIDENNNSSIVGTYWHRVVAEVYVDKPSKEATKVFHIDGNKDNNSASNLMWGTSKDCTQHSIKTSKTWTPSFVGVKDYKVVVDPETHEVVNVLTTWASLAELLGMSCANLQNAVRYGHKAAGYIIIRRKTKPKIGQKIKGLKNG